MKTKEELNAIKEEVETLSKKLAELSEEELARITGGMIPPLPRADNPFHGIFDGSPKTVHLYTELGPEWYDCSGTVD